MDNEYNFPLRYINVVLGSFSVNNPCSMLDTTENDKMVGGVLGTTESRQTPSK